MLYKYIIPSNVQSEIEKNNFGREVVEKLEKYKKSEKGILEFNNENELLIDNVWISKPVKNSGPRYIWYERRLREACVYALRAVYQHDEYERKVNDSTKHRWVAKHPLSESDDAEISSLLKDMLEPEKRELLPDEYRTYESRDTTRDWPKQRDELVFESNEWRDNIKKLSYEDKKAIYYRLMEIIKGDLSGLKQKNKIFADIIGNIVIYLRVNWEQGGLGTRMESVFLLNVTKESQITLDSSLLSCYNSEDCETLKRRFNKSYSLYLFGEGETKWIEVEEQDSSNLTLSKNEYDTMREIEYPFFLSGLSGSGKSTILQYLFACAFHYQTKHYPNHKLLFLSYSKKLTEKAFELVYHLLRNTSNYFHVETITDSNEREKLRSCFQSFTEFLKDVFLDEDEKEEYTKENYINYESFKNLYNKECKLPEKEKYSAALVWAVIRTYIKGESDINDLTPNDYQTIYLKQKSQKNSLMNVNIDDFEHIYRIYKEFYRKFHETKKKSDKKKWDDMDLIRTVLRKEKSYNHFHQYAVVFCDEMQDFTKLELKLIFKLTAHSQYRLSDNDGLRIPIPIALAGDPNQTINPTGFSFSAIHRIFDEVFIEHFKHIKHIKPYFLKDNYRSKERIVRLANIILYLRNQLFDGEDKVTTQTAWNVDNPSKPGEEYLSFIPMDENYEKIKYALCKSNIITADDGEYALQKNGQADEYTEKRKKNLDIPENKSENSIDHRLYTALSSKGLEFSTSVLFKFSSDEAIDLFDKKINYYAISKSEDILLSHFFTKLYISLSRAKNGLFIVDTKEGYEKFWKYLIEDRYWKQLKSRIHDKSDFLQTMSFIPLGVTSDFVRIMERNYRPEEDAKVLFEVAMNNEDSDKMRRAAYYYHDAGSQYRIEENESMAYAYLFDSEYEKAGELFKKTGKKKEAFDAFWKGECWSLAATCDISNDEDEHLKWNVANYMCDNIDINDFLFNCHEMKYQWNRLNEGEKKVKNDVLKSIINKIDADLKMVDSTGTHKHINRCLDFFFCDDSFLSDIRAILYYYDGEEDYSNYKKAVALWESGKYNPTKLEYCHAKFISNPSPSNKIKYFNAQGKQEEIISQYGIKNLGEELDNEAKRIVFEIFICNKDFEKALKYPICDYKYKHEKLYDLDKLNFLSVFLKEVGSKNNSLQHFKDSSDIAFDIIKKNFRNDFDIIIDFLNTNNNYLIFIFKSQYWKKFLELKVNNEKTLKMKLKQQNLLAAIKGAQRYCKDKKQALFLLDYVVSFPNSFVIPHEFSSMIIDAINHSIEELSNFRYNRLNTKITPLIEGMLRDADEESSININNLIEIYREVCRNSSSEKEYSFMDVTDRIISFLNPTKNASIIIKLKSQNVFYMLSGKFSLAGSDFLNILHEHDLSLKELAYHLSLSNSKVLIQLLDYSETKKKFILEIIADKECITKDIDDLLLILTPMSETEKGQKDYSKLIDFYDYCIENQQFFRYKTMLDELEIRRWLLAKMSMNSLISVSETEEFLQRTNIKIIDLENYLKKSDFLFFLVKLDRLDLLDDCLLKLGKLSLGRYHVFDTLFTWDPNLRNHLKEVIVKRMTRVIKQNEVSISTQTLANSLIQTVKYVFPNKLAKEIYKTLLNIMVDSEHNSINSHLWKIVSNEKKTLK